MQESDNHFQPSHLPTDDDNAQLIRLIERINAYQQPTVVVDEIQKIFSRLNNPQTLAQHAEVIGLANASIFVNQLATVALSECQIEQLSQIGLITEEQVSEQKAAAKLQIVATMPPFALGLFNKLNNTSLAETVLQMQTMLEQELSASDILRPELEQSYRATIEQLNRFQDLLQIESVEQRTLALTDFSKEISQGLFSCIYQLSDHSLDLRPLLGLLVETTLISQNTQQYLELPDGGSNIAKLLLSLISLSDTNMQVSMTVGFELYRLCTDFWVTTTFTHLPSEQEFANYADNIPSMLNMQINGLVLQLGGLAMMFSGDQFLENFFDSIRNPVRQKAILRILVQSIHANSAEGIGPFLDSFAPYCDAHPESSEARILHELQAQYRLAPDVVTLRTGPSDDSRNLNLKLLRDNFASMMQATPQTMADRQTQLDEHESDEDYDALTEDTAHSPK